MNMLMPRDTIEMIVANRDKTIERYEVALAKISEADEAEKAARAMWKRTAPGHAGSNYYDQSDALKEFNKALHMPDAERYMRTARRLIDISVWSHIVEMTDLESLMDKEAKDQLRDQMRFVAEKYDNQGALINEDEISKMMPPVTVDNVYATLQKFQAEGEMIFRRGLANAFSKLDRRFRSHDGFKMGNRIILDRAFDDNGRWSHYRHTQDILIDVERALQILDDQSPRAAYGGIVATVDRERQTKWAPQQSEHEGEFFRIRIFKNGNAHLWFTRKDLLEKANKVLAEWYGEVIGDGHVQDEDVFETRKTTPAKNFGFFPTPDDVVDRVIHLVAIRCPEGEPQPRVLEPSAGTGQLSKATVDKGARVDCIEVQAHLAERLKAQGIYGRVFHQDFLEMTPQVTGLYDYIVMNPPFDRERDIDHVTHALKFLKEHGCLIAIMSAGIEYRETRKSVAFRELMAAMNAKWEDLPSNSFSEVGTNVNTCLIRVYKDRRTQNWW